MPYEAGTRVIFTVTRSFPYLFAEEIDSSCGSTRTTYTYDVECCAVVESVTPSAYVVLQPERGSRLIVSASDGRLRPAHYWERFLYYLRFRACRNVEWFGAQLVVAYAERIDTKSTDKVGVQSLAETERRGIQSEQWQGTDGSTGRGALHPAV
ncbi:MAG: hypothetical protein KDA60_14475 [Planctomycetales bacterium]|nr:hypothetical protein [Planctomycetales bacterium]